MYKWDPIWGVNNKIFFLGAKYEKDKPFFLWKCDLYHKNKILFSPPKGTWCKIYEMARCLYHKKRLYFHHQRVQDYVREVFIKINFLEVSPMII